MKYAYVSGITDDNFLIGVLIMFRSLNMYCEDKAIERLCFVTDNVSDQSIEVIKRENIIPVHVSLIKESGEGRWKTTFQKLSVFSFTDYDKIVWIDADMMVCNNLDKLFNKPHMSCVKSRSPKITGGISFNSGLMVIEPNINEYNELVRSIDGVVRLYTSLGSSVGDQNILNEYYDEWPMENENLLNDGYNVFWGSIEKYLDEGYSVKNNVQKNISILHFTGLHKPWHRRYLFIIKSWIRSIRHSKHLPNVESRCMLKEYYEIHDEIINLINPEK